MSALVSNLFDDEFETVSEDDVDNILQFPTQSGSSAKASKSRKANATSETLLVPSKSITAEEEKELVVRAKRGDVAARNALILANMKLVNAIAKKYSDRGLPLSDLVQEGSIGLMTAVEKFDLKMGHRFSTYASWWVREAITRSLSNKSRVVRLPVHLNELMTKIRRVRSTLSTQLGRTATIEEIAAELNESVEKIAKALDASQHCMSLDQKVSTSEDEGCTLGDTIEDETSVHVLHRVNSSFLKAEVSELLSCLKPIEREVIKLRFGFVSDDELSLREIADKLNLTRDQVGKISCSAMRKLKQAANQSDFEDYLAA